VLAYGLSHVKTPRAAEKDEDSVAHVQQPEYLSSMRTLPLATCDPKAKNVMLKASPVEKVEVEPGDGDSTCSAPPSTVTTLEDINTVDVSTVDVKRM
jgi:hypothetical protein